MNINDAGFARCFGVRELEVSVSIPAYLLSKAGCEKKDDICYGQCIEPVKQNPETKRWYITMGHPGFNSDANNGAGYAKRGAAIGHMKYYGGLSMK